MLNKPEYVYKAMYSLMTPNDTFTDIPRRLAAVTDNMIFDSTPLFAPTLENQDDRLKRLEKVTFGVWSKNEEDLNKTVSEMDMNFLRVLCVVMLNHADKEIKTAESYQDAISVLQKAVKKRFITSVKLDEIFKTLDIPKENETQSQKIVQKTLKFSKLVAIYPEDNGYLKSIRHTIVIEKYEPSSDTITLSSPYLAHVVKIMLRNIKDSGATVSHETNTEAPKNDSNGTNKDFIPVTVATPPAPDMTPCAASDDSYQDKEIKEELAEIKRRRAVELVCVIARLTEQIPESGTLSVSYRDIMRMLPEMDNAFTKCNDVSHRNRILRNAFGPAWSAINDPTYTKLQKKFKDIDIIGGVPTTTVLDDTVTFNRRKP